MNNKRDSNGKRVLAVEVVVTPKGDIQDYTVDTMTVNKESGERVHAFDQYHEIDFVKTNKHVHEIDDTMVVMFLFVQGKDVIRPAEDNEMFDGIKTETVEREVIHRIFSAA